MTEYPSGTRPEQITECIRRALDEDLGPRDITTNSIVPYDATSRAQIVVKEAGVIAGLPVARAVFLQLDETFVFNSTVGDGTWLERPRVVAELFGSGRALLTGERTALNFLGRMSGIATLTRKFVDAVAGTKAIILDTRKTAPGLRAADKLAVRIGGAQNHRAGLHDQVLIKDNHIQFAGSVPEAVRRARDSLGDSRSFDGGMTIESRHSQFDPGGIEVEVTTIDKLRETLNLNIDLVMLDNMPIDLMCEAVKINSGRAKLEASGSVTLENVRAIAETGVDYISVGALTHSPKCIDVGLRLIDQETSR